MYFFSVSALFLNSSGGTVRLSAMATLSSPAVSGSLKIYPRRFDYYDCIPLQTDDVILGIYVLKGHPKIVSDMIRYVQDFAGDPSNDLNDIM